MIQAMLTFFFQLYKIKVALSFNSYPESHFQPLHNTHPLEEFG